VRIAFYTLGCKLNQAETESLAARFSEAGYQIVSLGDVADIYVANTCTVTHIADRKSRHWLRLARRRNPQAFIIATGCYAQRAPQELASIADLILNNEEKEHMLATVADLSLCDPQAATTMPSNVVGRVRSLIKIQDGCHSPCAYCIVPKVRSHEYSVPASQIIGEIKQRVAVGYKEAVLTGTKIGCYRDDSVNLKGLVERILCDTDIERLHLSSLQPQEISPEFLVLWREDVLNNSERYRLCRHFHLALQSGSDSVLQKMRRCYSLDGYHKVLSLVKETIPGVAITTDIMVGFPGEDDDEFEQSYWFCQQAGFANIHVFPFSPRPGTGAAEMPDQVKDQIKKERTQKMLELARTCRHKFEERFLGQIMLVLWEKEVNIGSGVYSGLTDNYIRVFTWSDKPLTNEVVPVKLTGFHNQGMWGELVGEN
jgi:MiaB-like tRNA modifying enzyme